MNAIQTAKDVAPAWDTFMLLNSLDVPRALPMVLRQHRPSSPLLPEELRDRFTPDRLTKHLSRHNLTLSDLAVMNTRGLAGQEVSFEGLARSMGHWNAKSRNGTLVKKMLVSAGYDVTAFRWYDGLEIQSRRKGKAAMSPTSGEVVRIPTTGRATARDLEETQIGKKRRRQEDPQDPRTWMITTLKQASKTCSAAGKTLNKKQLLDKYLKHSENTVFR